MIGAEDVRVVTNMGQALILKNVHHVQDIRINLMSARNLDDRSYILQFTNGT